MQMVVEQKTPIVSVLMPTYNCEAYVDEAIQSILNQEFQDFELLLLHKKSNDKSLEIIEKKIKSDLRARIIDCSDLNLSDTLNYGLTLAKGIYIARMDADDVSTKNRFNEQIRCLEQNSLDICGSHVLQINESGKLLDAKIMPLSPENIAIRLAYGVPFAHGSVLMRREFINKNDLKYDSAGIAEDYSLWIKFFYRKAKMGNANEFLFKYRVLDSSASVRLGKENRLACKKLRKEYIKVNKNVLIEYLDRIGNQYINFNLDEKKYILILSIVGIEVFGYKNFYFFFKKSNAKVIALAISALILAMI